jgi:hypothetical protein
MAMIGGRMKPFVVGAWGLVALTVATSSCGRRTSTNDPGDSGVDVANVEARGSGGSGATGAVGGSGVAGGAGGTSDLGGAVGGSGVGAIGGQAGGVGPLGGQGGVGGAGGGGRGNDICAGSPPPDVIFDCFANLGCVDGMVSRTTRSQGFTCRDWPGECPSGPVVATCRKGCAQSRLFGDVTDARSICREAIPKVAGDPCQVDDDCRPTVAVATATEIKNVTLRCDSTAGKCVEGTVIPPSDWLAACTPGVIQAAGLKGSESFSHFAVLTDPNCSSKVCIAAGHGDCVRQGCSSSCR